MLLALLGLLLVVQLPQLADLLLQPGLQQLAAQPALVGGAD